MNRLAKAPTGVVIVIIYEFCESVEIKKREKTQLHFYHVREHVNLDKFIKKLTPVCG